MIREQFLAMCRILGDQNLPVGERWKSIVSLRYDSNSSIAYMQPLIENKQIQFVDKSIIEDGKRILLCGFFVTEVMTPDVMNMRLTGNEGQGRQITFINMDFIMGATFRNGVNGDQYVDIPALVLGMGGEPGSAGGANVAEGSGGTTAPAGSVVDHSGNASFTREAWKTNVGEGQPFYAELLDAEIIESHFPIVTFNVATKAISDAANISGAVATNGKLRLYADHIPSGTVFFEYTMFKL